MVSDDLMQHHSSWPEEHLDKCLIKALKSRLKWHNPSRIQSVVLGQFFGEYKDHDLLLQARPGAGKTGAFLVPVLNSLIKGNAKNDKFSNDSYSPFAIILEPSKELCYQATQVCKTMISLTSNVTVLNTCSVTTQHDMIRLLGCRPQIIVSTPSQIIANIGQELLILDKLKYLIIDEADLMYTFGYHDDMQKLKEYIPQNIITFLASATLSSTIEELKKDFLKQATKICMKEEENNFSDNLLQYRINCSQKDKYTILYAILKLRLITGKSLIFVNSVNQCYKLKIYLEQFGINSCILNPELPLNSRLHSLEEFNRGKFNILIASDMSLLDVQKLKGISLDKNNDPNGKSDSTEQVVGGTSVVDQEFSASRGIDFQDTKNILNFDCPLSVDSYIHRVGRTARFESKGYALTFVTDHEMGNETVRENASGAPVGSDNIFTQINEATDNRIKKFNFKMESIDAMKYRCEDIVGKITKQVIKKYRIKEIKLQILNSAKLKEYFETHVSDKYLLRKQIKKPVIKKLSHLQFIPEYLVPKMNSKVIKTKAIKNKFAKAKDNKSSTTKVYHSNIVKKKSKKKSKHLKSKKNKS